MTAAKPPYSPSGEGSETAENATYHRAAEAAFVACGICAGRIEWLDPGNDHGGYWAHEAHPDDGHEAAPDHGDHYEADDA